MLGHLSFAVANLDAAAAFYDATLAPLGVVRVWTTKSAVGYGKPDGGDKLALKAHPGPVSAPSPGFHVAFDAPDRDAVDAFYHAAIASGGRDNGPPGLRIHYGPHYYAAFVIDPDGYHIEAVFQQPTSDG